jgi:hypothetical protein
MHTKKGKQYGTLMRVQPSETANFPVLQIEYSKFNLYLRLK